MRVQGKRQLRWAHDVAKDVREYGRYNARRFEKKVGRVPAKGRCDDGVDGCAMSKVNPSREAEAIHVTGIDNACNQGFSIPAVVCVHLVRVMDVSETKVERAEEDELHQRQLAGKRRGRDDA